MTTIVTRLYDDPAHADAAVAALKREGFPESALSVIEQSGGSSAQDKIEAAGVPDTVARQYAQHLTSRRALLVVRAPFVPFGAARKAIEVADAYPAIDAGVADENKNIPEEPDPSLFVSILGSHRLFLTNPIDVRNDIKPRGLSAAFRIPTLSSRGKRMRPAVIDRGPIVPMRRLSDRRFSGRLLINRFFADFILPHLSGHKERRDLPHYRITN